MEPKTNEETMMRQSLLIIIAMLPWITAPVLASQPPVLVLQDVNVLSMENDRIATGQTVIVRDGVIAWIGARGEADVPEGAHVVTGPYYVIPGMAEMHAHIPSSNQGEQAMLDALTLYLANGITTIRGMLGQPAHLELRGKAARGEIVSPRIFTSGPGFSGGSVDSPETGRRMVREQAEAGYDLLKFHPGLTLDQFEAITEEANRIGIEFSGHISHAVGLERSLEAGKGSIDHLDRYMEFIAGEAAGRDDPPIIFFGYDLTPHVDVSLIPEAARLTREAGVWNVPTNTLLVNVFDPDLPTDEMMDWPGMEYISPRTASNWAQRVNSIRAGETYDSDQARRFLELRLKITRALHEEGAGLMLGADAPQIFNPPGFSAHRELALLVDAGLTPFEALRTGTVKVAEYLGEDNSGKVLPGYRADLVLLTSNPLESIPFHDRIAGVVSDGQYFSRDELDTLLEEIRRRVQE
jgi:imidazolonepropionase-like amidohydrolase